MKAVVLLLFAVVIAPVVLAILSKPEYDVPKTDHEIRAAWKLFLDQHHKMYASQEEGAKRFGIFKENLQRIEQLNQQHTHATFGITQFADLTPTEFKKTYLSNKFVKPANAAVASEVPKSVIQDLPTQFDWRSKNAVTPVKDQGACGSCWAFSTTGNVEGQWFLAGHKLVSLSEQNLVDCDHECSTFESQKTCDAGCNGGLMQNAYQYIIKNKGIDTEDSYPYAGYDGTCKFKPSTVGATISNWTFISTNEDQMAAYLVAHGPLSIAASAIEWQFYFFGVFDAPCGTDLDHGILIVGYGEETDWFGFNIKYWIVKNSWSSSWGVGGYLYIIRGVGECGLNTYTSSAIV